jgi:aspartyl protease
VVSAVPFRYIRHLITVPVRVADVETRFGLDTGIGVNLISAALAERVGCLPDGSTFTGRRMSGQEVTVPLGTVSALGLGEHTGYGVAAGIFDMQAMAGLEGVEGFLSLTYFREVPVTIDYPSGQVIAEDPASLAQRAQRGTAVTVRVEYDRCSTDLLLGIDLPSGRTISAEVDTGSDAIVLDVTLAAEAGVDLTAPDTHTHESTDETGHRFTRYFATVSGEVSVTGAPEFRVAGPEAMFQKIIYDGLIGDQFLRNFVTTYDLAGTRMIFAPRSVPGA